MHAHQRNTGHVLVVCTTGVRCGTLVLTTTKGRWGDLDIRIAYELEMKSVGMLSILR